MKHVEIYQEIQEQETGLSGMAEMGSGGMVDLSIAGASADACEGGRSDTLSKKTQG